MGIKVAIVGGGPVGLILAYQLTKIPECEITLFEKRDKYTRKQILLVSHETLATMPKPAVNLLFGNEHAVGCGTLPPSKDKLARCYVDIKNVAASARTSDIEKMLLRALRLHDNITIVRPANITAYKTNANGRHLLTVNGQTDAFDVVVGADGAGSWVRQHILRAKFVDNKDVRFKNRYGAVFNFDHIPPKKGVFKEASHAHIRKVQNIHTGQNQYRFFRGKGIYYIGMQVSAEDMHRINKGDMPAAIKYNLKKICQSVTPVGKGCDFSHMSSMAAFPIAPQRSTIFAQKRVYLVGDAAMTTHYFTGTGFNIGVQMAMSLVEHLKRKISQREFIRRMQKYANTTAEKINAVEK